MSDPIEVNIVKPTDGECVRALLNISREKVGQSISRININLCGSDELSMTRDQFDSEKSQELQALKGRSFVTVTAKFGDGGASIRIHRQKADAIFDTLSIDRGQPGSGPASALEFARLAEFTQNQFRVVSGNDLGPLLGPDVAKHIAAREEALSRLETLIDRGIEKLVEAEATQLRNHSDQRLTLENEYQRKESSQEGKYGQLAAELEEREANLAGQLNQLDDRSNRQVRRELRGQLKEAIKQEARFKFSPETHYRRLWVLLAYLAVMLVVGVPLGMFIYRESPDNAAFNPWYFGRQVALAMAFAVTVGFFVRWLNEWAAKTANEEFKLRQFELDIDRASWLVELILEAKSTPDTSISTELVDRLSRNLFASTDSPDHAMTAADALASTLLTSAAGLELAVPGGKVSFNKKSMSDLKKRRMAEDE